VTKGKRWGARTIAIAGLVFSIAGGWWSVDCTARGLDDTAQVIAGFGAPSSKSAATNEGLSRSYAQDVATSWNEYERRIGRAMRQWACQELPQAEGVTVFYPFSGPDLPWAFQLYPDADRYVLVALEKAGAPPRLESFSREELEGYMATFRKAWRFYGVEGFFRTNDLIAETQAKGTRLGNTGPLMAFAARLGFEIEAVDPIQLDLNTSDLMLRDATPANDDTWDSVRLRLRKDGRRVVVDYMRMDLSDASLDKEPGVRRWIERMAGNPTILKAASHHPQEPAFSIFRDSLLANAPSIVQDETGIAYGALSQKFSVRLYGRFTRPNSAFSQDLQRGLAAAYRGSAGVKALPFRLGYEKDSGAALQVASRGQEAPRKCATPDSTPSGGHSLRARR
jgi:hypothetical protein